MKKRLIDTVCLLFFLMLGVACNDHRIPVENATGRHTLTLKLNSSHIKSRAEESVEELNENLLNSLDCFFYTSSADEETTPAVCYRSFSDLAVRDEHELRISFTDEEMEDLFGTDPVTGATCKVYVIANRPTDVEWAEGETAIHELKALSFTSDSFMDKVKEEAFVMDSSGSDEVVLTVTTANNTMEGIVSLSRAAAKISLVITQVTTVEEKDAEGNTIATWTANPDEMILKFHQGVKSSTLDTERVPPVLKSTDYFDLDTSETERTFHAKEGVGYELELPYYSYASEWENDATHEVYFTLIVPWIKNGATQYEACYYQIPVNTKDCNLVRNNHYQINLEVSRLGSFVEQTPVELPTHSYVVLDWNKQSVDVDIQVIRFLSVENNHVVLNNLNEVRIPYVTSHEAEIVNISCTKINMINGNEVAVNSGYTLNLDEDGNIYYKRELNNNFLDDDFDFSPYTINLRLQHKDNNGLFQLVTIVQYPAIYGQIYENWDYDNNYNNKTGINGNNGFVFVNGYQGDNSNAVKDGQDFFCSAPGIGTAYTGASPNMYVFTVSSVQGTNYVIGDPRENIVSEIVDDMHTYNSQQRTIWYSAPSLTNGVVSNPERILQHYYATDDTDRTLNMIAPKFRIASAYAVLHTNVNEAKDLNYLKKRCASYQEDGYPAGRWRLPTKGEFEFIFSLVNRDLLPDIYQVGSPYWCAHGLGTPNNDGRVTLERTTTSSGNSVRCVYDEWYWTDKLETPAQKNVFTWGDKQR